MRTINAQFKIKKAVFESDGFCIYAGLPVDDMAFVLKLNKYNNCSLKTDGLKLKVNKTYSLEIEEVEDSYGISYKVISNGLSFDAVENITPELNYQLLTEIMTDTQASAIQEHYPNFVQLVLTNQIDRIDVSKIRGVGSKLLEKYVDKIKWRCSSYLLRGDMPQFHFTEMESRRLLNLYGDIQTIKDEVMANPYKVLVDRLNRSFWSVDAELAPEYRYNKNRIEYLILEILRQNEYEGHTWMPADELGSKVVSYDPEIANVVVDVVDNSESITLELDKNLIQRTSMYYAEKNIADFIKNKVKQNDPLDWNWEEYTNIKDGTLTDEQKEVLRLFCKYNFVNLIGNSGCVDCETEYFNGREWKKISEYTYGDKVLQYNKDGTAELVHPYRYIKAKCDEMYHFETKYGLNQTLTADHTVVYQGNGGGLHTRPMSEIMDMHDNNLHGFKGKFYTTFHYNGNSIGLTDEEIRVMCAVICDGSFDSKSTKAQSGYMRCSFNIKKERKKERLRKLFCDANILWKEKDSTNGYTKFYIHAPRREKAFGSFWYNCSNHQLQVICDEIMYWDGNTYKTENGTTIQRYSTTVKANADFIQFAFSACGKRANLHTYDRRGRVKIVKDKSYIHKSIDYEVSISSRNNISIYNSHRKVPITKVVPSDGYKYCFTVPSHMLVLRRKDKIFITGNCGKTSSVMALLQMIEDNGLDYICVSPTGRAAQRLSEQTGRPAHTIHMACIQGEIYESVIIVDEVSMLSVDVCNMLFNAIQNDRARIVFVGDDGQLPPVGVGRILRDTLSSGVVPTARLTKCFRFNEGGMAMVGELTRRGTLDVFEDTTTHLGNDFVFIPFESTDQVVTRYIQEANEVGVDNVMLLTPYNKGEYGTVAINNAIQSEINPLKDGEDFVKLKIEGKDVIFHVGDTVLNCKNNYGLFDIYDNPTSVMNGATGKIICFAPNEDGDTKIHIEFDGEEVVFDRSAMQNLKLGYAISVHKCQGSEAHTVINLTIRPHMPMLSRQLSYTARTRARKKMIEFGTPIAIDRGQGINLNDMAYTRLNEFLTKEE